MIKHRLLEGEKVSEYIISPQNQATCYVEKTMALNKRNYETETKQSKLNSSIKAKVVLRTPQERKMLPKLALKYDLYPNQTSRCKQDFLEKYAYVFDRRCPASQREPEVDVSKFYAGFEVL